MKVSIYARVSTDKQTVDNQIQKLKEYIKIRGWELEGIYTDVETGRKRNRPGLNELLSKVKGGKTDAVLSWKLDRLARSVKDAIYLSEFISKHNRQLILFGSSIDTTTAEGKFFFQVTASFAELESNFISERTKLSYEAKSAHAKALGKKVRWGRKNMDFEEDEIMFIKNQRLRKVGWRKITDQINQHRIGKNKNRPKNKQLPKVSYSTIRRAFQNRGVENET